LDISQRLQSLTITKAVIGWNLEDLEAATYLVDATTSDSDDESSE
jgi:protein SHQ1